MVLAGARWGNVSAARIEVPAQAPAPAWSLADLAGRLVELSASTETAHLTAAFGLVLEAQLGDDRAAWVALDGSSFFPPDVIDTGIDLDALPVVRVPDVRAAGRAADHLLRSNAFGLVVLDLAGGKTDLALPTSCLSRPTGSGTRSDSTKSERRERQRARAISASVGVARLRQFARGADEATVSSAVSPKAAGQTTRRKCEVASSLPVPILSRLLGLAREHGAVVLLLTRKAEDAASMHSLISLRADARWRRTEAGVYEVGVRVLKDKRSGPGWTHTEICRGPDGLR
jgi:recombination protein RecA